ncbi:hypothetical protein ABIC29_000438 [Agromyces sp. PvR057]
MVGSFLVLSWVAREVSVVLVLPVELMVLMVVVRPEGPVT